MIKLVLIVYRFGAKFKNEPNSQKEKRIGAIVV